MKTKPPTNSIHYYLNRNLESLKGEKWKDVKDFEGLYEVSNFGRVKALPKYREVIFTTSRVIQYWSKEILLKQTKRRFLNKYLREYSYCLTVSLFNEGSYSTYMVPRLVFTHFGPGKVKLSKEILILHKDNDSLNNHIDNLYAASHSKMHKVAYKRKRKKSYFTNLNDTIRKTYTSKAAKANNKPVTQYNQEGKRIRVYKSGVDASIKTGIKESSIWNAIAGRYLTAGGYIWQAGKGATAIDISKTQKRISEIHQKKCKPIRQYSISGRMLAEFQSIGEGAKAVNGSPRQLSDAIHGRSKTAYGFKWKLIGKNV